MPSTRNSTQHREEYQKTTESDVAWAKDHPRSTLESFKNSLKEGWESAKDTGSEGYNKFMDMVSGEHKALDQEWREAKTKGGEVSNDLKERTHALSHTIGEMKEASIDETKGWTQAFADKSKELWDGIKDYSAAAGDKVAETYEDAKDAVKAPFQ